MSDLWDEEVQVFLSMSKCEKVAWLSRVLFYVSMFGRGTYEVGTDNVESPKQLRIINEFLHRIASFQLDIIIDKPGRIDDEEFLRAAGDVARSAGMKPNSLVLIIRRGR